MTDSTLKSVVVFDPETQGYKPSTHNLAASDAVNLVEELSGEGKTTKVLDQEERHRTSDAAKCRACQKAAATASQPADADETSEAAAS
jgi:UDP-glucose 6-dehydrogenase